jgi:hypothetical protein
MQQYHEPHHQQLYEPPIHYAGRGRELEKGQAGIGSKVI